MSRDDGEVFCAAAVGELQPDSYIACGRFVGYDGEITRWQVRDSEGGLAALGLCNEHERFYRDEGYLLGPAE